jgi:hypothetical protein
MKDRTLTLLDTHGTMIAKVTMTNNKKKIINIETDVTKCLKACSKDETWL